MKLAVLFSGGKDSTYAAWIAQKEGYTLSCLVSVASKNLDSFMFHTPSISRVEKQAKSMGLPLIVQETKGEKETELEDLEEALGRAINLYGVGGVVTGAVESVYQASRIQRVCHKLGLECFNPLWQKDQVSLLKELVSSGFEAIVVGVAAYPLDENFLGKRIDTKFIEEMKILKEKNQINPAGEGGEFESFVLNCPLFKKRLEVKSFKDSGENNSWRRELEIR